VITEIDQVFVNTSGNDVAAIYSFPVPSHAAVAEFTYWIDGKPVTGEVLKKQAARDLMRKRKPLDAKQRWPRRTNIEPLIFQSIRFVPTAMFGYALSTCKA